MPLNIPSFWQTCRVHHPSEIIGFMFPDYQPALSVPKKPETFEKMDCFERCKAVFPDLCDTNRGS